MSRRKVLSAFCVFISITLLVSIVKYWPQPSLPPRPMFYNVFGPPKMGRDTWLPEYPISDQHGAHAYYDTHLNILVILVLDNPETRVPPPYSDPHSAVLGYDTKCQTIIKKVTDQLILVYSHGQSRITMPLTRDQGLLYFDNLSWIPGQIHDLNPSILVELLRCYSFPPESRRIIEDLCPSQ
jgi:hypothetical protein